MGDIYYWSAIPGGNVCRRCGAVVMEKDTHDDFHRRIGAEAEPLPPLTGDSLC
jgi:hypothetical protein